MGDIVTGVITLKDEQMPIPEEEKMANSMPESSRQGKVTIQHSDSDEEEMKTINEEEKKEETMRTIEAN